MMKVAEITEFEIRVTDENRAALREAFYANKPIIISGVESRIIGFKGTFDGRLTEAATVWQTRPV